MAEELKSLDLEELKQWYATFNNIINKYGGGAIGILPEPDGGLIVPSDVNDLYDRINSMKNDEYLGTLESGYDSVSPVTSGQMINRTSTTPIINTVNKIIDIKCRNTTTFTNLYNSNGDKSNGDKGNGTKGNGQWQNENNANGMCTPQYGNTHWCNNSVCYWGDKGNVENTNGTHTQGKHTKGEKTNESQKDILNINTTYNKNT